MLNIFSYSPFRAQKSLFVLVDCVRSITDLQAVGFTCFIFITCRSRIFCLVRYMFLVISCFYCSHLGNWAGFWTVEGFTTGYQTLYVRFGAKASVVNKQFKVKGKMLIQPYSSCPSVFFLNIVLIFGCVDNNGLFHDIARLQWVYLNVIKLQVGVFSNRNLLALPVGIKQKDNVNAIVQKVLHSVLLNVENVLDCTYLPDFVDFSFFQRISQLFYSTMMAMWMDGGILNGVRGPYTQLLRTRQSGKI